MRKGYVLIGLIICLVGLRITSSQPVAAAAVLSAPAPYRYFPETGHSISSASKQFYDANGGLAIFGLPLTEVITDTVTAVPVQYFERARFELAPTGVSLTRLGSHLTADWPNPSFWALAVSADPRATFYAATGHALSGAFQSFYTAHGGLAVFGYPISEPFYTVDSTTKQSYTVQYFERARFALPTDAASGTDVQLGLVGSEYARRYGVPATALAPVAQFNKLGESTVVYPARSAAGTNMRLAAEHLDGVTLAPGVVLSFNATLGEVSTRSGYAIGQAVVQGRIQNDVGGGICMVSTALYQAALRAGLEIVSRRGHSVPLNVFADTPGMDAAVSIPDLDFQLRNDTPMSLRVYIAMTDSSMSVSLWGVGDGRTTTISKPVVSNKQASVAPVWRSDATLQAGTFQQVSAGSEGMDVTVTRKVFDAQGKVMHTDTIRSHYAPLAPSYTYGPGVDPSTALTPTVVPPSATPAPATPSATSVPEFVLPTATDTAPSATPVVLEPTIVAGLGHS